MTPCERFFFGVAGSVSVDVLAAAELFNAKKLAIPPRYKNPWFFVTRVLVALIGGLLAIAGEAGNPLNALNVGASAPLGFRALGVTKAGRNRSRRTRDQRLSSPNSG